MEEEQRKKREDKNKVVSQFQETYKNYMTIHVQFYSIIFNIHILIKQDDRNYKRNIRNINIEDDNKFKVGFVNKNILSSTPSKMAPFPIEPDTNVRQGKKIIHFHHLKNSFNIISGEDSVNQGSYDKRIPMNQNQIKNSNSNTNLSNERNNNDQILNKYMQNQADPQNFRTIEKPIVSQLYITFLT